MVDELELLKKEYEGRYFDPSELKSFEIVDCVAEEHGRSYIVKSAESGRYFEIFEADGFVEEFTEVIRSEELKVVVSWLPV
jgi:hypothetical protein